MCRLWLAGLVVICISARFALGRVAQARLPLTPTDRDDVGQSQLDMNYEPRDTYFIIQYSDKKGDTKEATCRIPFYYSMKISFTCDEEENWCECRLAEKRGSESLSGFSVRSLKILNGSSLPASNFHKVLLQGEMYNACERLIGKDSRVKLVSGKFEVGDGGVWKPKQEAIIHRLKSKSPGPYVRVNYRTGMSERSMLCTEVEHNRVELYSRMKLALTCGDPEGKKCHCEITRRTFGRAVENASDVLSTKVQNTTGNPNFHVIDVHIRGKRDGFIYAEGANDFSITREGNSFFSW